MNLSERLKTVKDMVVPCEKVCDVGCDHGYVSISLVKEKIAKRTIACDVNKGPLKACEENVVSEGLEGLIETRLSDGLHNTSIEDGINAIVIAGMGARLMCRILTEGMAVVGKASQLVLQPQSELFLVREWIRNNNFYILKETMVCENGKYYFVMDVRPGKTEEADPELQHIYDCFSKYLILAKDRLLKEYLRKGIANNLSYLEGISSEKQQSLLDENRLLNKVLSMMEG